MKIIFIAHDFSLAGAQNSLLRILNWLKANTNWQLGVLALARGTLETEYNKLALVETIVPPRDASVDILPESMNERVESALRRLMRRMDGLPDLVVGNTVVASLAYPAIAQCGVPLLTRVAELPSSVKQYASPNMISAMLHHSTAFVGVSSPVVTMLQNMGVAPERISCLPGVIADYPTPPVGEERIQLEQRLGIDTSVPILWGVGSASHRKGADLFYNTCLHLYDLGITNFQAVWAGHSDSSLDGWSPAAHPAQSKVHFIGEVNKPYQLMKPGDIFVLSSREDPFPLVSLEAAERGLPIVAFAQSGGSVDLVNAGAGILAEKENPTDMAVKLATLLSDKSALLAMGQRAHDLVMETYTIERVGPQWVELLSQLCAEPPKSASEAGPVFFVRPSYDLSIIIRSVGERTTALCHKLAAQSVPERQIRVISEKPFGRAVRKGFEVALDMGATWTLVLDADVLLAPGFVKNALQTARRLDSMFVLQGLIFDKFFHVLRPAGNHLYTTSLLDKALDCIPPEGSTLRPESSTITSMTEQGYRFYQQPLLAGLHDFEQHYADIAKKCFLQAHKHTDFLPLVAPRWGEMANSDADFQVALASAKAGLLFTGNIQVDADFLGIMTRDILDSLHLSPKPPLQQNAYTNDKITALLKNYMRQALQNPVQQAMFPPNRWDCIHEK